MHSMEGMVWGGKSANKMSQVLKAVSLALRELRNERTGQHRRAFLAAHLYALIPSQVQKRSFSFFCESNVCATLLNSA